jgi:hypothetical protein
MIGEKKNIEMERIRNNIRIPMRELGFSHARTNTI